MSTDADHQEPESATGTAWHPGHPQESIRAILNALPAMVAYWDRDLRNRMANDAYMEYFGRSPEEMYGAHISEVLGSDLYASNRPFMERALAGQAQTFDREIPIPSGEIRYTQASYIPDLVDGQVRGFFVLVTDITERHTAEVHLHESEERYRTLAEHLPGAAITLVDADLRLSWFGGGVPTQAGLDVASMIGLPVGEASGGGEHGARIAALYQRALDGEEVAAEVHSQITGRDFSVQVAPLRSPAGDVTAALGVAQDITERKRSEAALRLQSQITENMAEGALLMRAEDLVIIHANATIEQMFGYAAEELVGAHVSVLNAPDGMTPEQRALDVAARVSDGSGSWSGEILSIRKDGSTFWRHSAVSRFEHPEHGTLLVSVIADVTERREREAEEVALSRLATLVAEGAGPAAVLGAVAIELQKVFAADTARVVRFDAAAQQGEVLADAVDGDPAVGGVTVALDDDSATAQVFRTQRDARTDRAIAAPILVVGALWGAVAADFGAGRVPAGAEQRLTRFSRLAAVAISNAEAWDTLSRQASTDAVTGIANHRTFHERLSAEVERARRYGRDLSLVLFDVDHFKTVNDHHGHQVGDRVLAEVARRLAGEAREGELVARIGGEEFAWLMPETPQQGAYIAADRVRAAIENVPFEVAGTVTVSAGVCSSAHGHDPEALVRYADRALYWAKDSGRNTTFVYTEQARDLLANKARTVERFQAMSSVRALARAIDSKDWSTHRHSERVAELAQRLALQLGWTTKRARLLHACGLLHDVGKIGIADGILLKPGPLTPEEYEEIKRHAALSAYIAAEVLEDEQVSWIRGHHERWDGKGYPDALTGPAIPDGAQLLALADAWDVMTETRAYKASKSHAEALAEIDRERGGQFAPAAVDALHAIAARGALSDDNPQPADPTHTSAPTHTDDQRHRR